MRTHLIALLAGALLANRASAGDPAIVLGSKKFTESYVLSELAKRSLEEAGFHVDHRQGMGGTIVLWEALKQGSIAAYPDYTGTIQEEILKRPTAPSIGTLREEIGPIRSRHHRRTRIQQYLRPGDDQSSRETTWHSKN